MVSFLSCPWAWQLCRIESLHQQGYHVTTAMLLKTVCLKHAVCCVQVFPLHRGTAPVANCQFVKQPCEILLPLLTQCYYIYLRWCHVEAMTVTAITVLWAAVHSVLDTKLRHFTLTALGQPSARADVPVKHTVGSETWCMHRNTWSYSTDNLCST